MSKIEWTNETWNPIIGCTKISEGCKECYAEKMANRLANMKATNYYQAVTVHRAHGIPKGWNGKTYFVDSAIQKPLNWKKPRMIFVCSMGDLFHESVPFEWQFKVFQMIHECPQHTFQILTKRSDIMLKRMKDINFHLRRNYGEWIKLPLPNVWHGVTVENQNNDNRIIDLLNTPAAKRFVSCEPLLSNIDFHIKNIKSGSDLYFHDFLSGEIMTEDEDGNSYQKTNQIDWVIAGPETGSRKRPMKKEWIENIYQQCKAANVPLFDKKDTLELNLKQFPK